MFTHSEVGTGQKVYQVKTENRYRFPNWSEIMTTGSKVCYGMEDSKNVFCHLLGNFTTIATHQFRLLIRRVRDLQLRNMLVAVRSQEICMTEAKY